MIVAGARPAKELSACLSEDDLFKLIAECSGYSWRWWKAPTLFTPRLWKAVDSLKKLKDGTTAYQNELSLMLYSGNFVSDLQLACQSVPRPLTVSLFFMLLLWSSTYCMCETEEETKKRSKTAAKILYSLVKD
ncbi:protein LH2 [Lizard adenovirus 2]|uniref:Protein LH2 n=1 Tax=Lizard adenovirus 2 TaxID=874272 RepID=A0A076FTE8_9ADEN|nr:protein LH2 [Lizard adenovirus 2]AII22560.1 protein LH2 [Lizard adenovirus 2]